MGEIATEAAQVFRDGFPSPHKPVKAQIRDLFDLIDEKVLGVPENFSAWARIFVQAADEGEALDLLGADDFGRLWLAAETQAAGHALLGGQTAGIAVYKSLTQSDARTAVGATATGSALLTAANVAAAQTTLGIVQGLMSGLIFQTRADLYAFLTVGANTGAQVVNDPTVAYNGTYTKVGSSGSGSWTQVSTISFTDILLKLPLSGGVRTDIETPGIGGDDALWKMSDSDGVDGMELTVSGRLDAVLTPNALAKSEREAGMAENLKSAFNLNQTKLTGLGTISDIRRVSPELVSYVSDFGGGSHRFLRRIDIAQPQGHILDTPGPISCVHNRGQSWITENYDTRGLPMIGNGLDGLVFWLAWVNLTTQSGNAEIVVPNGALTPLARQTEADTVTRGGVVNDVTAIDFRSRSSTGSYAGANPGWMADIALQRLRRLNGRPLQAVVSLPMAYPGATIAQLSPGGEIAGQSPWAAGEEYRANLELIASRYGKTLYTPMHRMIHHTQGADYDEQLDLYWADVDALDVNDDDLPAQVLMSTSAQTRNAGSGGIGDETETDEGVYLAMGWADANSTRATLVTPTYWCSLRDNIHWTPLSAVMAGEIFAWAQFVQQDLQMPWSPMRVASAAWSVEDDAFKVTFTARPVKQRGNITQEWLTERARIETDVVEEANQYGFAVRQGETDWPVTVTIVTPKTTSGLIPEPADYALLTPDGWSPLAGDYEVSYGHYGVKQAQNDPSAPGYSLYNNDFHPDVWGNVCRDLGPSVLLDGYKASQWLFSDKRTVTIV